MSNVQAYPLQWPPGFPRTKFRENSRFRSGYDAAAHASDDELPAHDVREDMEGAAA